MPARCNPAAVGANSAAHHRAAVDGRAPRRRLVDEVALSFRQWSPDGAQASAERVGVQVHGEYAVATLPGIALMGEGTYVFELSVNGDVRTIGVQLVAFDRPGSGQVH